MVWVVRRGLPSWGETAVRIFGVLAVLGPVIGLLWWGFAQSHGEVGGTAWPATVGLVGALVSVVGIGTVVVNATRSMVFALFGPRRAWTVGGAASVVGVLVLAAVCVPLATSGLPASWMTSAAAWLGDSLSERAEAVIAGVMFAAIAAFAAQRTVRWALAKRLLWSDRLAALLVAAGVESWRRFRRLRSAGMHVPLGGFRWWVPVLWLVVFSSGILVEQLLTSSLFVTFPPLQVWLGWVAVLLIVLSSLGLPVTIVLAVRAGRAVRRAFERSQMSRVEPLSLRRAQAVSLPSNDSQLRCYRPGFVKNLQEWRFNGVQEAFMLIRFEVENFRSIAAPVELTLVATDDDRAEARPAPKLNASLVATAGLFGPNASGKSTVLAAMLWLRDAVRESLVHWDEGIPIEPNRFGAGPSDLSSFALELLVEGVRFEYLLDLDAHHVDYEALFHYPQGRRRKIFERDGQQLTLQRGLGELSGTRALLSERSLVLSIMRRFDEPSISAFTRQLVSISSLGNALTRYRRPDVVPLHGTMEAFNGALAREGSITIGNEEFSSSVRARALSMLQMADLGIVDVEFEERPIDTVSGRSRLQRTPKLVHATDEQRLSFDYAHESAGTRAWFQLIGPLLRSLEFGEIVLFDELDAKLHPTLTAQLVRLFQSPSSNPKGAQLLFTAHDTNLLNHLNRDEVWLTEKRDDGSTHLAALSDFAGHRVRRSQNIEAGYLSGRFGALPDVTRPWVLRELGLIG